MIDEAGAFDEDFFLYWEDADWCRRIADAGFQTWCVPKARVVHDEGGTRGHAWPVPVVVPLPPRRLPLLAQPPRARAVEPHPLGRRRRRWPPAAPRIVARDRLRARRPGRDVDARRPIAPVPQVSSPDQPSPLQNR